MDFKKLNSKSKLANILGLVFLLVIVLIFVGSNLNFINNDENYNEKLNSETQTISINELPVEKELINKKKKILIMI